MSKHAQQIGIHRSDCGVFDVESNLPKKKKEKEKAKNHTHIHREREGCALKR